MTEAELVPFIFPGDNVRVLDKPGGSPVPVSDPWGGVWRVKRRNPKGWGVEQLVTNRKGTVRFDRVTVTTDPYEEPPVRQSQIPSLVYPGTLVRFTDGFKGYDRDQVFVVMVDKLEKVNVAKLGGERGRYIKALRHSLELVDISIVQIVD